MRARLTNTNVGAPAFQWSGATHRLSAAKESVADIVILANQSATITVTETKTGESRQLKVASIVDATPSLIVPGQSDYQWVVQITGIQPGSGLQVDPGPDLTAASITILPNGHVSMLLSADATATPGLRDITVSQGGQPTVIKHALTVYRGVMSNLIDLVNRPAAGTARGKLIDMDLLTGPRTQDQENRIAALLSAADRDQALAAWNNWTRQDGSLTVLPTGVNDAQVAVLIDAAFQYESGNSSFPAFTFTPLPPIVPLSLWKGLMAFLAPLESGYNGIGSVVALAGATNETSAGLMQFNDARSAGSVFAGGTNAPNIPIYDPGRVTAWKDKIIALQTLADLSAFLATLDQGDWRADPYASLINLIRSSYAYYGRLIMAPGGGTQYDSVDDFRVDAGSGRANGQGSQRDCFELFSCAHRFPGDVFGNSVSQPVLEGGLLTAPTPNEWHASTANGPSGHPYMTQDGVTRATEARTFYDSDAPSGGYL